jgi:hypothetical protein
VKIARASRRIGLSQRCAIGRVGVLDAIKTDIGDPFLESPRRNSSNNSPTDGEIDHQIRARDLGPVGVKSPPPFRQRARVGKAERLSAHEPQASPLELLMKSGLRWREAAGKYVALDKIDGRAVIEEMLLGNGDHLKNRPSARLH